MKKNGFTLIEVIAVIAILGIILTMTVPSMVGLLSEKKNTLYQTIVDELERFANLYLIDNPNLYTDIDNNGYVDITTDMLCSSKYVECPINDPRDNSVITGYVRVTLNTGDYVYEFVRNSGTLTALTASTLSTKVGIGGLTETDDGNIRYVGANVNNYVTFGNGTDKWRIIGVFTVKNADTGANEKLIKIVRDASLGNKAWSEGVSEVNNGWGLNQWGPSTHSDDSAYAGATLMTYLNTEASGAYTNAGINSIYASMIQNVEWNTAGFEYASYPPSHAYNKERGTGTGKICTSGTTGCTDTVTRTTKWTGKVGLIYPSDYGFAGGATCTSISNTSCGTSNWLNSGGDYWTISPIATPIDAYFVCNVFNTGGADSTPASGIHGVRPSIYLKSDVKLTGSGTSESPYILSR